MDLAGTWLRATIGAAGATLLAPAAMVVAVALVAVGGGGLGGLGSLGQLVSGPALPGTDFAAEGATLAAEPGTLLAAVPSGTSPGPPASAGEEPAAGPGPAGAPGGRGAPPRGGPIGRVRPREEPRGGGPGGPPSGGGGGGGGGGPPDEGGVVHEVGSTAKGVAEQVPAPLGPTAGDLIDALVGTCEGLPCP